MDSLWKIVLSNFFILRCLTFLAAIFGYIFLRFEPTFPYWDAVLQKYGHRLYWSWANFDGVHYLLLAEQGYQFALVQAFFPLYFLLIRFSNLLFNNFLFSALLLSHIFIILALIQGYKLLRFDLNKQQAKDVLTYMVLFPTSFYFLSAYTESLFLFLLFTTFYFIRTKKWLLAGLVGIALTLTRFVGIFIVPALIYEIWLETKQPSLLSKVKHKIISAISIFKFKKNSINKITQLTKYSQYAYGLIPLIGLISYMVFLQIKFDDAFLFINVQSGFGANRQTDKLILLYQVFWRYLKMIFTVDYMNTIYYTIILEFITTILFLFLLVFAFIKKIRTSYLIFAIPAFILPTLTGTLSSMPRYVLILFPAFVVLSYIRKPLYKYLFLAAFTILMIISTALFTTGHWIA